MWKFVWNGRRGGRDSLQVGWRMFVSTVVRLSDNAVQSKRIIHLFSYECQFLPQEFSGAWWAAGGGTTAPLLFTAVT